MPAKRFPSPKQWAAACALLAAAAAGGATLLRGEHPAGAAQSAVPARAEPARIHYTVSLANRSENTFVVEMSIPRVAGQQVDTLQMPAWNALYQVRDFAHRVQNVTATGAQGNALDVQKRDKLTWTIRAPGGAPVDEATVRYAVFWDEPGPFHSQLNRDHAFMNLAMILLYAPNRRDQPVQLTLAGVPAEWSVAVALPRAGEGYTFTARNYDALVDAPVRAAPMEIFTFTENGARIRVAATGDDWNRRDLEEMLRKVVGYQTGLMREVPFEEFLFLYHFGGPGGGGMEHANSTAIWSRAGSAAAGITAHEFFHLWNVKRIRPQSLEPVDYTGEQYTRALWFAEGVTSTYASFTLVRTGIWDPGRYYDDLARQISALLARPARQWQSVEQASLDAWHEKYELHRRAEFSISYYNKGQILGVLLDVLIRDATDNRRSLDDVLRDLNERYARRGRFYDDSAGIRAAVERVAGRSFADFFRRYVAGTDELPVEEVLALAGLRLSIDSRGRASVDESPTATSKQRRIREGMLRGSND